MSKHFAPVPLNRVAAAVALALGVVAAPAVFAGPTDTQTINFSVANISEIDVAAGAITLNVVAPTAGSDPDDATASTTYDITTNASAATHSKKITAQLSANMPTGIDLKVTVAAPTESGTSQSQKTLTSTAVDVVTGLQGASQTGVAIDYVLHAPITAPAQTTDTRTVTYTIVDL